MAAPFVAAGSLDAGEERRGRGRIAPPTREPYCSSMRTENETWNCPSRRFLFPLSGLMQEATSFCSPVTGSSVRTSHARLEPSVEWSTVRAHTSSEVKGALGFTLVEASVPESKRRMSHSGTCCS